MLYLTDTGRRWDGDKVSIRDRSAKGEINKQMKEKKSLAENYSYRGTQNIMDACKRGELPDQIMFNLHPQRLTDSKILWTWELVMQNVKNVVKRGLVKFRS